MTKPFVFFHTNWEFPSKNVSFWPICVCVCFPAMYVNNIVITDTMLFIYFFILFFSYPGNWPRPGNRLLWFPVGELCLYFRPVLQQFPRIWFIMLYESFHHLHHGYILSLNWKLIFSWWWIVLMDLSAEGNWRWVNFLDGSLVLTQLCSWN